MTKDVRMEEMSKFAALSGCTYNYEICFVGRTFIVCHTARYITETVTKLFMGRSVSAVDKGMYSLVSSAYKRWSNLWL